jgi:hypothetical protein
VVNVLGLKEAKDIADNLQADFIRVCGFDPFGTYSGDNTEPRFHGGKIQFIKYLRDFSKEAANYYTLKEAENDYNAASQRVRDAYVEYQNALDALNTFEDRLTALRNEQ